MATAGGVTRVVAGGHRLRRRTQTVYNYVEDAYLRDDIPCGSELCTSCDNSKSRAALGTPPLKADASHYLVPDAHALLARREPPTAFPYMTPRRCVQNILCTRTAHRKVVQARGVQAQFSD